MSAIEFSVNDIYLEPVREGTKIRAAVSMSDAEGNGGKVIVFIDPSDSVEEIKRLALAESKRLFAKAGETQP